MPNTKSAKKANRQNIRRREMNSSRKIVLKRALKEFKKYASEKKKDEAIVALSKLYKTADKVSKSNFIHKNKASRVKSRASKAFKKAFSE